jgi:hypothetical protein
MAQFRGDIRAAAKISDPVDLPVSDYPLHRRILGTPEATAGLMFDNQSFAVMALSHPPDSGTPDVMSDKDSDRVLILTVGDLVLQIGSIRYRMGPGDAVQIPRGTPFGATHSTGGAQMLWVRSKPARSFTLLR